MSEAILTLGKLTFAAIGIAVGIQLFASARERGAIGLHSVALAAICAGGLGLLVLPFASLVASHGMLITGETGIRIGMLLLCVFIAGTFRPNPVGILAVLVCSTFLIGSIVWDLQAQRAITAYDYTLPSSHANQLSIALPFLWATFESLLLWSRGRRRLALGLADPVIVERYFAWAVTTSCFVGITVLAMFAGWVMTLDLPLLAEIAHGMRGLLYLVITGAIWQGLFRRPSETSSGTESV